MPEMGKMLFFLGLVIALAGLALWKGSQFGIPLGRLPGDIHVEKGNFSFHFPIVTCIVISLVLTLIMWLLKK